MNSVNTIGHLEELILLIVASEKEGTYGVSIAAEYVKHFKKGISIPAIHTSLRRLEKKGYLKSSQGGITKERGGRRKRIYQVTDSGLEAISQLKTARQSLYEVIGQRL